MVNFTHGELPAASGFHDVRLRDAVASNFFLSLALAMAPGVAAPGIEFVLLRCAAMIDTTMLVMTGVIAAQT